VTPTFGDPDMKKGATRARRGSSGHALYPEGVAQAPANYMAASPLMEIREALMVSEACSPPPTASIDPHAQTPRQRPPWQRLPPCSPSVPDSSLILRTRSLAAASRSPGEGLAHQLPAVQPQLGPGGLLQSDDHAGRRSPGQRGRATRVGDLHRPSIR